MNRNKPRGISLLNVIIGGVLSGGLALATMYFLGRYQQASGDLQRTTEANSQIDEMQKAIKKLWMGRARDSVSNCNCSGAEPNCPAVTGGDCSSHHLVTGPTADCQGLRVFRAMKTVHEYRDFVTICHPSAMPGFSGQVPSAFPSCGAGNRPIIQQRINSDGTVMPSVETPALNATDVVAGSACVRLEGAEYVLVLNMLVRLSRRIEVLQRKMILSPRDRSSNIEYLSK